MVKLIGLTGAHGTGKSTVLKTLRERGYHVLDESLARKAQSQLGFGVESAPSIPNMMRLQDQVAQLMIERDQFALTLSDTAKDGIVFVDRSPIDVVGYSDLWAKENYEDLSIRPLSSLQVKEANQVRFRRLMMHLVDSYAAVAFFPLDDAIPFVAESGRASEETRVTLQEFMQNAYRFGHYIFPESYAKKKRPNDLVRLVKTIAIETRADELIRIAEGA